MPQTTILIIGCSTVLLLAILTQLALKPKTATKLTAWSALGTAVVGLVFYGYGYSSIGLPIPLAVIRSTMSVCGMFLGKNEIDNISSAPLFQSEIGQILFWLVHLAAFYATAGAAISTIGSSLVERVRLTLARKGDLLLIYGVSADSVAFAKQMQNRKGTSIVFVDPSPDANQIKPIQNMGCLPRTDAVSTSAGTSFLKRVGVRPGERNIWLYCLHKEQSKNLYYASAFKKSAQELGICQDKLHLTLLSTDEAVYAPLLGTQDTYGYGDVNVINEAQMVARLLIQKHPPCNVVTFDENGRAQTDLDCLLIGYGRIGQAVLDQLICHGQFAGSKFHATVFALDFNNVHGKLACETMLLLDQYDLTFHASDARSREMYEFLREHRNTLNYITIAAGNEKKSEELAWEICHYLNHLHCNLPVYLCSYTGVLRILPGELPNKSAVYDKNILWSNTLDRRAMVLNQTYCQGNGLTAEQNWAVCDYFSRLSSRASADFAPVFLRMAGMTREEIAEKGWKPQGYLLENLAETEHMRWCAFHHTMGFSPMDKEIHAQRTKQMCSELVASGKSRTKPSKDMTNHIHACLIPWDLLDDLSDRENEIIQSYPNLPQELKDGKKADYKQLDRNNILALQEVLEQE